MRKFVLPLLLVFSFTANAQNWDLFPLNQKSVYVDSTQALLSTEQHVVDSIRISGNVRTLYFDQESSSGSAYGCEGITGVPQQWAFNSYIIDSLVEVSDTVYFQSTFSTTPFYFLPQASVGQSWSVISSSFANGYNTITITCAMAGVQTFLGLTDSVKVFSLLPNGNSPGQLPISNQHIVLSKNYGLLSYVPFDQFMYHPANSQFQTRELVGLQIGAITAGYQRPVVSGYFHLSPGDLRSWELHFMPAWIIEPETLEYMKDSITGAVSTSDSVVYTFDRTFYHYDQSVSFHEGLTERYWLPDLKAMLEAPGYGIAIGAGLQYNSFGIFEPVYGQPLVWTATPHEWIYEPLLEATVEHLSLYYSGSFLDTAQCQFLEASDLAAQVDVDNWAGVTRKYLYNINETTQTLLGFRINGIVKGLLTVGVNQARIINRTALTIQPNPAKESITFQGIPQGTTGLFTVFDGLGREVMSGSLSTSPVSVGGLHPGLYVVQLRLQDRTTTARFVKE
ncbi:MAG: T9SS type A sorting domain-containing protein [Flavobacteriales bacterium]|jgi:hypothetical protein